MSRVDNRAFTPDFGKSAQHLLAIDILFEDGQMTEKGKIFIRSGNGGLEPLQEAPFDTEDELQELVADYPELLAGEQIDPANPRRWILIKREQGIPDRPDAGDRWSVDHLLIDQDAVPTLVEVKLSSNSEIRRRVVGQMLDYAAHATGTWSVTDDIREAFEYRETDPEGALSALLTSAAEPDIGDFWEAVEKNLWAKRLRLLFVADRIPDELARVVGFLNEQLPNIEVLAVEIKRYKGEFNETLVPHVIGRLAAQRNRSGSRTGRRLTRDEFLNEFENGEVRLAARRLLNVADTPNASIYLGTRGVNIRVRCPLHDQPLTVAWIYPTLSWGKVKDFSFGAGNGTRNGRMFGMDLPEELEEHLKSWVDEFSNDTFADCVSGEGVVAYTVKPEEAVKHISLLESRLKGVINRLANLKSPHPVGTTS